MTISAKFSVSRKDPVGGYYTPDGTLMKTVYERIDGEYRSHEEECSEEDISGWNILLTPDYAGGRNKEWAEATPSGSIQMTINNPAAYRVFEPGKAFTVLFEEYAESE